MLSMKRMSALVRFMIVIGKMPGSIVYSEEERAWGGTWVSMGMGMYMGTQEIIMILNIGTLLFIIYQIVWEWLTCATLENKIMSSHVPPPTMMLSVSSCDGSGALVVVVVVVYVWFEQFSTPTLFYASFLCLSDHQPIPIQHHSWCTYFWWVIHYHWFLSLSRERAVILCRR